MSRLTSSNKHHTNIRNNTSDIISTKPSSDEKKRSHLDTTIREVKQEFRSHHQQLLVKRKELITRLGKAFESILSSPKDVCEEIKNSLQEEIADKYRGKYGMVIDAMDNSKASIFVKFDLGADPDVVSSHRKQSW